MEIRSQDSKLQAEQIIHEMKCGGRSDTLDEVLLHDSEGGYEALVSSAERSLRIISLWNVLGYLSGFAVFYGTAAHDMGYAFIFGFLTYVPFCLLAIRVRKSYRAAMQALAQFSGPGLLGKLLDELRYSYVFSLRSCDLMTHNFAQQKFVDTLPLLTDADAGLLTKRQQIYLVQRIKSIYNMGDLNNSKIRFSRWWLVWVAEMNGSWGKQEKTGTELAILIVNALAHIGDKTALDHLKPILKSQPKNDGQKQIQHALEEALPLWNARLQGQQVPRTLLRAASAPDDTLLRTVSTLSPDPKELLRADSTGEAQSNGASEIL